MIENASLSDYLTEFRRGTPRERLLLAIGLGAAIAATGAFLGAEYASLAGLGCAVAGVSAWALMNQMADLIDSKFEPEIPAKVRRLRLAGIAGLAVAGLGVLLVLTSFFFRVVQTTTGL